MLITIVTILHIFACVFLILVVLLQTGKGAEMGAVFGGGGSSTIFGASGAGNFLTKLTTATAVVFFLTSLTLAWSSLTRTQATIFDQGPLPEPPPREAPAAPEGQAAAPAAPAPAEGEETAPAPSAAPPAAEAPAAPEAAPPAAGSDAPPPPAAQ